MAQVRWTVREAAEHWGVSLSAVHKWVQQQRVEFEGVGGSEKTRPAALIITSDVRPTPLPPGALAGRNGQKNGRGEKNGAARRPKVAKRSAKAAKRRAAR